MSEPETENDMYAIFNKIEQLKQDKEFRNKPWNSLQRLITNEDKAKTFYYSLIIQQIIYLDFKLDLYENRVKTSKKDHKNLINKHI